MKKVLYISNILAHIHSFHVPYILMLKEFGYEVDVIANSCGEEPINAYDRYFDIPIERNPFSLKNVLLYRKIKDIIDSNGYDLIHVHTPMGGVLGRLCARKARKNGTKVLYTSHGFHFFKGASLFNRIFYFNAEKLLARMTDGMIVINNEDFNAAKRFLNGRCQLFYMDGVGVDLDVFHPIEESDKALLKNEFGYSGKTVILYAAEFIKRKNHRFLIDAFSDVVRLNPEAILLLAGKGPLFDEMKRLVESRGLNHSVIFLGYRRDIPKLLSIADLCVSTSRQEGFPINVAESIASGVPAIVSDIRGNVDIVENGINGLVYRSDDKHDFICKMSELICDNERRKIMSIQCSSIAERINIHQLVCDMKNIYSQFISLEEV